MADTNRASALTNLNEQELRRVDSAAQEQVKGGRKKFLDDRFLFSTSLIVLGEKDL
ncbi:MAG: hypothetical protein ABW047_12055 [Nitrospiraceae bacterium]